MPATISVTLPPRLAEILGSMESGRSVALLHAALDGRTTQVICLRALMDAEEGLEVAVICRKKARVNSILSSWTDKTKIVRARRPIDGSTCFELHAGGKLWVCDEEVVDDPPFSSLDRVFVLDANETRAELARVSAACMVAAGGLATREHWFSEFASRTDVSVERLPATEIVDMFPDQKRALLPKTDPMHDRLMLLDDTPPKVTMTSFVTFCRTRLKVRTDKHSTLLRPEQQLEIAGQFGTPIVSFYLSKIQKRMIAMKRLTMRQGKKPWFIILKSRRWGATSVEQARSYQIASTWPRSYVATLAHTADQTARTFTMMRTYAKNDRKSPGIVGDTRSEIRLGNDSLLFIGTAGGHAFGRGDAMNRAHGTEVAYWCEGPNQASDIDLLVAGLQGAVGLGELTLESTANGFNWYQNKYQDSKLGVSGFTPIFLPWFEDPLNRMPAGTFNPTEVMDSRNQRERELMDVHGLDIAQIAFRQDRRRSFGPLFPQEFPEDDTTCFLSFGTCFFDVEAVVDALRRVKPPISKRHVPGGLERVWLKPDPTHSYAIGVDTAEGINGGDRCKVAVIDRTAKEQAYSLHGLFRPDVLAEHVDRIKKMYPGLCGVERENYGHAVLQRLGQLGHNRPHYFGGDNFFFEKDRAGWTTNRETRPIMLEALAKCIHERAIQINDDIMLNECLSFRLQNSGKFEADASQHDDCVMGWAIALQMAHTAIPKPRVVV